MDYSSTVSARDHFNEGTSVKQHQQFHSAGGYREINFGYDSCERPAKHDKLLYQDVSPMRETGEPCMKLYVPGMARDPANDLSDMFSSMNLSSPKTHRIDPKCTIRSMPNAVPLQNNADSGHVLSCDNSSDVQTKQQDVSDVHFRQTPHMPESFTRSCSVTASKDERRERVEDKRTTLHKAGHSLDSTVDLGRRKVKVTDLDEYIEHMAHRHLATENSTRPIEPNVKTCTKEPDMETDLDAVQIDFVTGNITSVWHDGKTKSQLAPRDPVSATALFKSGVARVDKPPSYKTESLSSSIEAVNVHGNSMHQISPQLNSASSGRNQAVGTNVASKSSNLTQRQQQIPPQQQSDLGSPIRIHSPATDNPIKTGLPRPTFSLEEAVKAPSTIPGKLDFSQLEVFEGNMLLQWLMSGVDDDHPLYAALPRADLKLLLTQFCTYLMSAGVIKQLDSSQVFSDIFKSKSLYSWTYAQMNNFHLKGEEIIPGKLEQQWPPVPSTPDNVRHGLKYSEAEHQAVMVGVRQEYKTELDKYRVEQQSYLDKLYTDYTQQLDFYKEKCIGLQKEVEKYKILAGIEELTQSALSDADAASREAGFKSDGFLKDETSFDADVSMNDTDLYLSALASPEPHNKLLFKENSLSPVGSASVLYQTPNATPLSRPFMYSDLSTDVVRHFSLGTPSDTSTPRSTGSSTSGFSEGPSPPSILQPPPEIFPHSPGSAAHTNVMPPTTPAPAPPPPPLPPPLPGSAIPPPPPPPGLKTMRLKPVVNPKCPMKPLFWRRLQIGAVHKNKKTGKLLWEDLKEGAIISDELINLFAKPTSTRTPRLLKEKRNHSKRKQVAKLIEPKRSQAIGIMLSTLKMDMADIQTAILEFDMSILDAEKLQAIYDLRPETEELKTISNHLNKNLEERLDKPEQFLYELSQVPHYLERIFCLRFTDVFSESISMLENKLYKLKLVTETFLQSKDITKVLGIVLAIGNYMNGGNRDRGQADGFDLDILSKLRDVKSHDNRTSLLVYIVLQYIHLYERDDAGTEKVKLPFPDARDIKQTSLVNFDDISKEIDKVSKELQGCEHKADTVIHAASGEDLYPFKSIMIEFIKKAKQDLKELEENLQENKKRFTELVVFYWVEPKPGEQDVTPEHFFSFWKNFCHDFAEIWAKEQQKIIRQRLKDVQAKFKKTQANIKSKAAVKTQSIKPGGKKDRLLKMGLL